MRARAREGVHDFSPDRARTARRCPPTAAR